MKELTFIDYDNMILEDIFKWAEEAANEMGLEMLNFEYYKSFSIYRSSLHFGSYTLRMKRRSDDVIIVTVVNENLSQIYRQDHFLYDIDENTFKEPLNMILKYMAA